MLHKYRLDPTDENNMKSWLFLRLKLLEDDSLDDNLMISINIMNNSFILSFLFGVLVLNRYFFVNKVTLAEIEINNMVFLTLAAGFAILIPIVGTLNDSVNAV